MTFSVPGLGFVSGETATPSVASKAASAVLKGNSVAGFVWLSDLFAKPVLTPFAKSVWLCALSENVSLLGSEHASPVVAAVLNIKDWFCTASLVKEYKHLLEVLVSAHPVLVAPVVESLVASLRTARTGKESPADLSTKFDHIHSVLNTVIRLIPTGLSFIQTILNDNFPHKSEDSLDTLWYLKNLFRIVSYAPVLRNSVWALGIDRALQIDVEIQSALDDLSEDDYNQVLVHCFDIDAHGYDRESITFLSPKTFASAGRVGALHDGLDEDDLRLDGLGYSSSESSSERDSDRDSDEEATDEEEDDSPPPIVVSDFRKMSGKLDSLLHLLMNQVTLLFSPDAPSNGSTSSSTSLRDTPPTIVFTETSEAAHEFFTVLLQIFERTLLPTHQCKYVQFLYFHACSLSSRCTESFLVHLAQKTFDSTSPTIIRVAASAYLSSFVARAKFVETESVLYCLKMLNGWALKYMEANEAGVRVGMVLDGGKTHACFYAAIQALLYVFCFRWREIVAAANGAGGGDGGAEVLEYGQLPVEMNGFQRLVQSRFQPLKVCTKSVVAEFARITHKLDMLYCYTHIQRPVIIPARPTMIPPHPIQTRPVTAIRTNNHHHSSSHPSSISFAPSFSSTEPTSPLSQSSPTTPTPTDKMSYVQESLLLAHPPAISKLPTVLARDPPPPPPSLRAHPADAGVQEPVAQQQQQQQQDTLGTACLEAFFPFDPCHLVMCKRILEDQYLEWVEDEEGTGGGSVTDAEVDFISSSFDNQMSISAENRW
ncbi:hypothetical protein HDU98_004945 [Podochytrium sp. JEL0797]|nr:hypothetical protein HDU98_004945 [Podochytrium sp. JEL0797]